MFPRRGIRRWIVYLNLPRLGPRCFQKPRWWNESKRKPSRPRRWGLVPEIISRYVAQMHDPGGRIDGARRSASEHVWEPHQFESPDTKDPTSRIF
ncbi:hypothetical protein LIER_28024 [Lithospermum erythrorhizon]|uniref:Uncharacterized protein n=1 Tax=Lithospermum erythrorhizon TaxID=34254 RepID=A0AAV3RHM3_LITER